MEQTLPDTFCITTLSSNKDNKENLVMLEMKSLAKTYTASTPINSQFSFLFDSDWSMGLTDKLTNPYSCDELKDPGQLYGGPLLSTQRNNILI